MRLSTLIQYPCAEILVSTHKNRILQEFLRQEENPTEMPKIAALFANAKEYSPTQGRIKGKLPEWLEGSFIRNGPGIFDIDDGNHTVNHFFDGFAMVCKFEIKNGKLLLKYNNTFILTLAGDIPATYFRN
ncbi:unnamed protein product [Allacma fusca]|uniref:Uncharacterized protein n=1 Tax=Allacma fusca TaxID=39272 RepID=A0A8J2PQ71_9HEXA|nr:unnamed protein product [Allacma fusca]